MYSTYYWVLCRKSMDFIIKETELQCLSLKHVSLLIGWPWEIFLSFLFNNNMEYYKDFMIIIDSFIHALMRTCVWVCIYTYVCACVWNTQRSIKGESVQCIHVCICHCHWSLILKIVLIIYYLFAILSTVFNVVICTT